MTFFDQTPYKLAKYFKRLPNDLFFGSTKRTLQTTKYVYSDFILFLFIFITFYHVEKGRKDERIKRAFTNNREMKNERHLCETRRTFTDTNLNILFNILALMK